MKTTERGYACKQPWPDDCFVQSGGFGVVLRSQAKGGVYRTAFFEAFPKEPKCFIRGEGDSVEDAEAQAYRKLQKHLACAHEFERLNDKGRGKCIHCNLAIDNALPSLNVCESCDKVGAYFPSPFDSHINDNKDRYCCYTCLIETVAPNYLVTPTEDLLPDTLDEDRAAAEDWYGERFDALVSARLILRLNNHPDFLALTDVEKVECLERLSSVIYRNVIRCKLKLVDKLLELDLPGVQYLDDAGYLEAVCTHGVVVQSQRLAEITWMKQQDPENEDLERKTKNSYNNLVEEIAGAVLTYTEQCADNPPPFADSRKRVVTASEMNDSLKLVMEALAAKSDEMDDEK